VLLVNFFQTSNILRRESSIHPKSFIVPTIPNLPVINKWRRRCSQATRQQCPRGENWRGSRVERMLGVSPIFRSLFILMLTETHAHLDYPDFQGDFGGGAGGGRKRPGVTRIVSIGTSLESSRRAVALAEADARIFAVAGVHPASVDRAGDWRRGR
jgi:hypothetical protein